MSSNHERTRRLAVLIDAENASPRIVTRLFEEVAAIGEASVRRVYGDFSGTRLKGWSDVLSAHAIIPQHNVPNVAGKNASDIALVIDAMDLLHTGRCEAFCLVSSDSDFTRLAGRIREQGLDVYGFGERKTPESFRKACRRFVCTESFGVPAKAEVGQINGPINAPAGPTHPPSAAVRHIQTALGKLDDRDGWYHLSAVGAQLNALVPGFKPKTYGCSNLSTLIEKSRAFKVKKEPSIYIKSIGAVGC